MKANLRRFFVVGASLAAFFTAAPLSQAVPTLFLNDGLGHTTSISNPTGSVTWMGAVGNFVINLTTGLTKPNIGSATYPEMTLFSVNITGPTGGGTLTIMFSDVDFGPYSGPLNSHIEGTTTGLTSYSTFADAGNSLFGMTTALGALGPFGPGAFSGDASSPFSLSSFSLTQMVVLQLGANGTASLNATLQAGTSHVPDGGPTVALLGIGLAAAELVRRKCISAK